ncbi:MAG: amidohydrolase family protein [Isosphaeraceae bacterium]
MKTRLHERTGRRRLAVLAAGVATTLGACVTTWPLFSADLRLDYKPAAYAIRGATLVTGTGPKIEGGTIVVRNGVIESVGPDAATPVPFDAETIDGKGLHVYPGFIDLQSTGAQSATSPRSLTGEGRALPYSDFAYPRTPTDNRYGITPEYEVATALELTDSLADEHRKLGFTSTLFTPSGAIAAGQSALVGLGGLPRRESVMKSPVALHIALRSPSGMAFFESQACGDDDLPHAIEALVEAQEAARLDSARAMQDPAPATPAPGPGPGPGRPSTQTPATPGPSPSPATPSPTPAPPETGRRRGGGGGQVSYPTSLMGIIAHLRQAMLDAEHHQALKTYFEDRGGARPPFDPALDTLHAARTRAIPVWWEANTRDEIHRVLDLANEFGTTAVIVGGREAWKVADRLKAGNVPVVLRLELSDEPTVPTEAAYRERKPEEREEPLAVLRERKRRWDERAANAAALARAGVPFGFATEGVSRLDTFHDKVRQLIKAGLSADAAVQALTRDAATIVGQGKRLGTLEPGKLGHLVAMTAPYGDEKARPRYVLIDGLKFDLEKSTPAGPRGKGAGGRGFAGGRPARGSDRPASDTEREEATPKPQPTEAGKAAPRSSDGPSPPTVESRPPRPEGGRAEPKDRPRSDAGATAAGKSARPAGASAPSRKEESPAPFVDVATEFDADRKPTIHTGGNAFIRDARILTVTQGTIDRGNILVVGGKIAAVGPDAQPRPDSTIIDGQGLVVMPGIIDTHSHIAIQGGVNEMSLSIVPEVRVKDVINGDDPGIYRALAGGTTTARLLHGSANTIGGQDAVIKLKPGQPGRELLIQGGPQGVKFALGENVTRRSGRFPNTRMGVEATIERAFEEGKAYRETWKAYAATLAEGRPVGPPPRRDLRLEALADILDGKIKIHSHCYRSDEILMLLRVAERYGVRVQSLQHVLEGYKLAAEIAAHGASASTFSDWWAYKVEAYDAIPFNAALLTQAGASVCIKSDDAEMMRHLNLEAAKTMKYGGLTEAQALACITINPARELGLDQRLGSIETGKDADLVLFEGHPFDATARCKLARSTARSGSSAARSRSPRRSPTAANSVSLPRPRGRGRSRSPRTRRAPTC